MKKAIILFGVGFLIVIMGILNISYAETINEDYPLIKAINSLEFHTSTNDEIRMKAELRDKEKLLEKYSKIYNDADMDVLVEVYAKNYREYNKIEVSYRANILLRNEKVSWLGYKLRRIFVNENTNYDIKEEKLERLNNIIGKYSKEQIINVEEELEAIKSKDKDVEENQNQILGFVVIVVFMNVISSFEPSYEDMSLKTKRYGEHIKRFYKIYNELKAIAYLFIIASLMIITLEELISIYC